MQSLDDSNRYRIIREYVDEGLSGLTEKRADFQRMLADLQRLKDAKVILLYDSARLSRQDAVDAGPWKQTLRNLGVYIHSYKQGKISWDTFENRILDAIHQEVAHAYSVGLSKDSIRGRLRLLEEGQWPNSNILFGYDRLYISPDGQEYFVRRLGKFKMGRGWRRYLIINEVEADVVRFIFKEFVERDTSLGRLAHELWERGMVRPDGNASPPWNRIGIKKILSNKAYAGWSHTGGAHGKLRQKNSLHRIGAHEKEGGVPPLVSLDTWERAQERLAKLSVLGKMLKPIGASALSGCVICGHCERSMSKHERTDKKGVTYAYFTCNSKGQPGSVCKNWSIRESELLPLAIETLIKEVDARYLSSLQPTPEQEQDNRRAIDDLKQELEKIDIALKRGSERLLMIDDSLIKEVERTLLEYRQKKEEIENRIHALALSQGDVTEFAAWWSGIKDQLVEVSPGHSVYAEDPDSQWDNAEAEGVFLEKDKLRGVLKDMGLRITCYFRKRLKSSRFYCLDHARLSATVVYSDTASNISRCRRT